MDKHKSTLSEHYVKIKNNTGEKYKNKNSRFSLFYSIYKRIF